MTRQADAAHHVGFEEAMPIRVCDLLERSGLEDAEIVDENIGAACAAQKLRHALGRCEIRRNTLDRCPCRCFNELPDGFLDGALAPAVDHDRGTGLCEAFGNRESDSGGRAADHRPMAMQIDFHDACPVAVAALDRQRRVGSRVPGVPALRSRRVRPTGRPAVGD